MPKKAVDIKNPEKTEKTTEKDSYILGAIAYLLGFLAILLYLVKKEDKFVRFHSLQAVLFCLAWVIIFVMLAIFIAILSVVTAGIGSILSFCMFPLVLVVVIVALYAAWKAFQGEMWHMPVIGDLAEKYA